MELQNLDAILLIDERVANDAIAPRRYALSGVARFVPRLLVDGFVDVVDPINILLRHGRYLAILMLLVRRIEINRRLSERTECTAALHLGGQFVEGEETAHVAPLHVLDGLGCGDTLAQTKVEIAEEEDVVELFEQLEVAITQCIADRFDETRVGGASRCESRRGEVTRHEDESCVDHFQSECRTALTALRVTQTQSTVRGILHMATC